MTEPKVSERIDALLTEYALAVVYSAAHDGLGSREVGNTRRALLSAIAELEQRAEKAEQERDLLMQEPDNRLDGYRELGAKCAALEEQKDALKVERNKWKRVAVALQKCRRHPQSDKVYPALNEAIAALGDEWDEAVR